ncbi:hypothetical protein H6F42_11485 [Pseudanabaena sp. FACHB-1998]|uniref:hypothetical protein n=1 Tax=Pseudanabaena sp. FACHB-1998 TaxID=2692858 RepID=UPI00167FF9D1|nr:hypothetical protein [Pseudanabaena sp. FACHB-1998]MBD2177535.1 hypothetical protein [Pseudanabaena sp. FACHB-1998]
MNTFNDRSVIDKSSTIPVAEIHNQLSESIPVAEIHNQLSESIKHLSPERLKVVADFAAFLANAESEAATQELLSISGLLERIKQNQTTPKSQYVNWKTVRSDV